MVRMEDLLRVSRFDRYNSFLAVFCAVWTTLLAGSLKHQEDPTHASVAFVFRQSILIFLHCYIFSGAGMVWNDWIDRDIDARVARTKDRPLASGRLRTLDALIWMVVQFGVSVMILYWMIPDITLTFLLLLPQTIETILYPYAKRPAAHKLGIYPQYLLGLAITSTVISAWCAIYSPSPSTSSILAIKNTITQHSLTDILHGSSKMCLVAFFWFVYLNTAYSYQDIRDDSKMNIHSLYVLTGRWIHPFLCLLGGIELGVIAWAIAPLHLTWLWVAWFGVWTVSYLEQLVMFDRRDPATGEVIHKRNFLLGWWTIGVCVVELVIRGEYGWSL